jgi:hypothetical protein
MEWSSADAQPKLSQIPESRARGGRRPATQLAPTTQIGVQKRDSNDLSAMPGALATPSRLTANENSERRNAVQKMHLTSEFREFAEARDRGLAPTQVVELMHERGLPIAKAVMGYVQLYQVSLMEADEAVGNHPVYREIWEASKRTRERLGELCDRVSERLKRYRERQP